MRYWCANGFPETAASARLTFVNGMCHDAGVLDSETMTAGFGEVRRELELRDIAESTIDDSRGGYAGCDEQGAASFILSVRPECKNGLPELIHWSSMAPFAVAPKLAPTTREN